MVIVHSREARPQRRVVGVWKLLCFLPPRTPYFRHAIELAMPGDVHSLRLQVL